jgi:hypothetical protein
LTKQAVKQAVILNPARTGTITITYTAEKNIPTPNPPVIASGGAEPPKPPIQGGVDPIMTLLCAGTYFSWADPATDRPTIAPIQVRITDPQGNPAVGRIIIFAYTQPDVPGWTPVVPTDSNGRAIRTDINGVITLPFSPFALPPDDTTDANYTFEAEFWGY